MPSSSSKGILKFLFSLYVFLHAVTSKGSTKILFGYNSAILGEIIESEAPESIKTFICFNGK